jgi:4-amino-4-deoxy-L-arabinose transferase-like glycosyltransferase
MSQSPVVPHFWLRRIVSLQAINADVRDNAVALAERRQSTIGRARSLVGSWYESERRGIAIWVFVALFVAVWTSFQVISFVSVDLHPDLVEVFAWSRHPSAGYYKHPPLNAVIAAAWFSLFPLADWSFHLLAMVNAAAALLAVNLIAQRYLSGDKRLLVVLLLLLTPFYQFHAQRFSTNQTLLSTWPIATYCFLRAFETRGRAWAAAAGVAAATAILGKYYSAFLVAGFACAAITHPARRTYFASASPWISAACGSMVLAPHLYWMVTSGFQPLHYAFSAHGGVSGPEVFAGMARYAAGSAAFLALPVAVFLIAARPQRKALVEVAWPTDPGRRMLVVLLTTPIILPLIVAPILNVTLNSLWAMQAWFLLPIVLLSADGIVVTRKAAVDVGLFVLAIAAVALIAAPALAWIYHLHGTKEGRSYYRMVAAEATSEWRRVTGHPLSIVGGDFDLAAAATLYSSDHPDYVPGFDFDVAPWITPQRVRREGWIIVCKSDDQYCTSQAESRAATNPAARRIELEMARVFLGHKARPARFVFVLLPPGI